MTTTTAPAGPYHGLSPQETLERIAFARESLTYWTRQKTLCTHPRARADAGARALAWRSTLAALKAHSALFPSA